MLAMAPLTKSLRLNNLWYLHVSSVRIAHDDLTVATSMLPLPVALTHNAFAGRDHPTPPPLVVDRNPEYVVKRTIHTKYSRVRRKCCLLVHIRWDLKQPSDCISQAPSTTTLESP